MHAFFTLLLCAACAGTAVRARDVAAQFEEDYARVEPRPPTRKALAPGRVDGSMQRTVRLAGLRLARGRSRALSSRYVRALLACAHLMHGENEQARRAMADLRPRMEDALVHENAVARAAGHAVDACTTVEGRIALEEVFDGRMEVEDFLDRYGALVGVDLPLRDHAAYAAELARHAKVMRARCFSPVAGDPRGMERTAAARRDYRRMLGEQVYNDAAALLGALPERTEAAETRWLAALTADLFVVHAYRMEDILPAPLTAAQKQWQIELAVSAYGRVRAAVERILPPGRREAAVARLQSAEREVIGWISTR